MRAPSSPARRLPTGCRPRTSASRWDGRGRFLANIFIERLWRSLKYEAVYLHELRSGLDAERIIWTWVDFYDDVRPHSPLVGRTPNEVYHDLWQALYIGQTGDLSDRLPNHEEWPAAVALGATHVHLRGIPNRGRREKLERRLIRTYQLPLNE